MKREHKSMNEDEFVGRYFEPLTGGEPGACNLGDDAAYLTPQTGQRFVLTTDTLIEGVHFVFDGSKSSAASVAHKALACNVSDLAAKGAKPMAYTLSLTLPGTDFFGWIAEFATALANAQKKWGLNLIGGDTTRHDGPLMITITAIGTLPKQLCLTRSGAKPGELIFVSGTIGDARLGLGLMRNEKEIIAATETLDDKAKDLLIARTQRPNPRIELIDALRDYASATIDVSDGLVRDLNRLCAASKVGGEINIDQIPISDPVVACLKSTDFDIETVLTGGDDYEILATVAEDNAEPFQRKARADGCDVHAIGRITAANDVHFLTTDNKALKFKQSGWDHLENKCS